MLGDLDGASVLDLFAGTGAMGLEAVSRGAVHATFVEIDRAACEVVQRNIDACVTDGAITDLVRGDAIRVVQTVAMRGEQYDVVFFDPPYERTEEFVNATSGTLPAVCHETSRIVVEVATRYGALVDAAAAGWGARVVTTRRYGDTTVAILAFDGDARGPISVGESSVPSDPDMSDDTPSDGAGE